MLNDAKLKKDHWQVPRPFRKLFSVYFTNNTEWT